MLITGTIFAKLRNKKPKQDHSFIYWISTGPNLIDLGNKQYKKMVISPEKSNGLTKPIRTHTSGENPKILQK